MNSENLYETDEEDDGTLNKDEWMNEQIKYGANEQVAEFIYKVLTHTGPYSSTTIYMFFRSGYCYYFANMLKTAFKRGGIYWTAPYAHMVWCDDDGTPYDIEGVFYGDVEYFIPESYLGNAIEGFLHEPGIENLYVPTEEEVQSFIEKFKEDNKGKDITPKYSKECTEKPKEFFICL